MTRQPQGCFPPAGNISEVLLPGPAWTKLIVPRSSACGTAQFQAHHSAAETLPHHRWSPGLTTRVVASEVGQQWDTTCTGLGPCQVIQVLWPQCWPRQMPKDRSISAGLANLLHFNAQGKRPAPLAGCLFSTLGARHTPATPRAEQLARHTARLQNAMKYLKSALQTKVNQT